ncbi:MAG: signal peptidase II [Paludibacteraceae bacterium]|nr:signal peptidase II [Paludibacteraceae bacterium]
MGKIGSLTRSQKRIWLVVAIVLGAVMIDQIIKLCVAKHMQIGESIELTSWFHITYVLNNGMAFGIEWFSKLALTLFRVLAAVLLGWYVHTLIRKEETPTGYIATLAFIIAGALGNLVDCVFYGKLMQGGSWLYGQVVDMFYFPLIKNASGEVIFFQPVFNFADSCITCGVLVLILFYWKQVSK